jgi:rRNA maturation endonuclease Nob1
MPATLKRLRAGVNRSRPSANHIAGTVRCLKCGRVNQETDGACRRCGSMLGRAVNAKPDPEGDHLHVGDD